MSVYAPSARRLVVAQTPDQRSHATDGHGRLLCDPARRVPGSQQTLDAAPTCRWCRLVLGLDSAR